MHYITAFASLKKNRAIYFPSYQILESYAALAAPHIDRRKVFIEPRDAANAGAALNEFLSLPSQGESGIMFAVCGGKWSEGLDYRGEMLSGAMVIGLPLAPFTRVRRMIIEYFRHKYGNEGEFLCYTLPAINRALQALGRVLRTPEDRGVLVLGEPVHGAPGAHGTAFMDAGRNGGVRPCTLPGVDCRMEVTGGSSVWALACPCLERWDNHSPGSVCDNGYSGPVPVQVLRVLCRTGHQPLGAPDNRLRRGSGCGTHLPGGPADTLRHNSNVRGDCCDCRDIPPRGGACDGAQPDTTHCTVPSCRGKRRDWRFYPVC